MKLTKVILSILTLTILSSCSVNKENAQFKYDETWEIIETTRDGEKESINFQNNENETLNFQNYKIESNFSGWKLENEEKQKIKTLNFNTKYFTEETQPSDENLIILDIHSDKSSKDYQFILKAKKENLEDRKNDIKQIIKSFNE